MQMKNFKVWVIIFTCVNLFSLNATMKTEEYKDCQLCKYLDCDTEGHFVCSKDGEILDHEGIYCGDFEEYKEEENEVDW